MVAHPRRVVFIVDADDDTRITHETILRGEGYELISAPDGRNALPFLREQVPDLVLLGGKIGTMPVLRLIQMLRGDVAFQHTCIIVVASVSPEARDDMLRAGAHVVMPNARDLVREVAQAIGRA